MIASLILAACAQEPEFRETTIPAPPGLDVTTTVVLLDDGTVAATWREEHRRGVHGEVPFAKPFVWDGKAHVALPLLEDGWGTVIHGRNGMLVGYVLDEYIERPCLWTPDAKEGWKKPALKVLDKNGWAPWVDSQGRVWISDSNDVACWDKGQLTRTTIGKFDLVGTAKDGKQFGNKYGGFGVGFSRLDQEPGYFENGKWTLLANSGEVNAVNDDGVAVGRYDSNAVVWKGGKQTVLTHPGSTYSEANAVSPDGTVLWTAVIESKSHLFLWRNGKSTDITSHDIGSVLDLAINGKGQILCGGKKLTLLTPVRTSLAGMAVP